MHPGNPVFGGMRMNAQSFWNVFLETGAPEMYLLYSRAKKLEETYVSDYPGAGAAGCEL